MITLPVYNAQITTGSPSAGSSIETQPLSCREDESIFPDGWAGEIPDIHTDAITMELKSREAELKSLRMEISETSQKLESINKRDIRLKKLGKLAEGTYRVGGFLASMTTLAGVFSAGLGLAVFLPVSTLGLMGFTAVALICRSQRKMEKERKELCDDSNRYHNKLFSMSDKEMSVAREYERLVNLREKAMSQFRSMALNVNSSSRPEGEPAVQDNDGYIIIENIRLDKRMGMVA